MRHAPSTVNRKKNMRRIRKVAVLGSGVMGSGIAAHFANIGLEVLLMDIVPRDLPENMKNRPDARNSIAAKNLKAALKGKPAPFYNKDFAKHITVGNFEDDMPKIKDVDWVIEVIVERLDIKKIVFEQVDKHRKEGSLVTSNTSSIPIHLMAEGRSDDFQAHFCGTHFFNPVRYMRLFEIIPTAKTNKEVTDFLMRYGDIYLGKQTVLCKDTPAFIANRIGFYSGSKTFDLTQKYGLTIEEVDGLTGPAIARPKTGSFRLNDLVGLDTNGHVMRFVRKAVAGKDEYVDSQANYELPKAYTFLLDNGFIGDKAGQGFYKKTKQKDEKGRKVILALNLETLEYAPSQRPKLPVLGMAKQMEDFNQRFPAMLATEGKGGQFLKEYFLGLFAYCSNRLPEISDDLYSIDDAMRTGYAWEYGPFEYWDIFGLKAGVEAAEAYGEKVADWVKEMVAAGHEKFYKREGGKRLYYDARTKDYQVIPGTEEFIILDNFRDATPVAKNTETTLHDIGDGVLCLEFTSKANSIGEGVLKGIREAIDIAEQGNWKGLVIGNNGKNFSVGANLFNIAQMAFEGDFEEINMGVDFFQQTSMRCRYSAIPVVSATQGYVFGGGCEIQMHCDATMAASESYIGLVEAGVGLIPGGGGTKEMAVRISDLFYNGDVKIPRLIEAFKAVAMGHVNTSAHQAYDHLHLLKTKDEVVLNVQRNISEAKKKVLELAENYSQAAPRQDIHVLGRNGLGALYVAANELMLNRYASPHDVLIAKKTAYVLCGGDLTGPQNVSEQYLLDIEREAFLSLVSEKKTMERISHMLKTNKPLRN